MAVRRLAFALVAATALGLRLDPRADPWTQRQHGVGHEASRR